MASSSPRPNPRKRGAPSLPVGSGNDRKRAKFADARVIAVQSSDPDVKSGQLDVNTFIQSREFEIKALENAMSNSKRANNKRAFQMVPRDMRRRTASHNVKRVPKRLRRRAAHEMKEDNTPTVTARRRKPTGHMRTRIETANKLKDMAKKKDLTAELLSKTPLKRKTENELRKPPRPSSKFRKRQKEKTWLPSHIWHAKRAKMITRWRFAVAETPTEKSYRPTHRASQMRGAVAWEESYFSTVLLAGKEGNVKEVLRAVCGKGTGVLSNMVVVGKRSCETWIYKAGEYPTRPIAPVTIVWCVAEGNDMNTPRKLFIRVHPSAFLEMWKELLPVAKQHKVTIEDLRFEIGSIEITGPGATDALLAVLHPSEESSDKDSPARIWSKLRSLTNPSVLPPGAILGLNITDPRLRFPPRLPTDKKSPEDLSKEIFDVCSTWPVDKTQGPASLFSREFRTIAVKSQPSQKRINCRKGDAAPGEYPAPLPTDPKIPILLLTSRRQTLVKGVSGAIGSWTIMVPWKWVLPIWYGIMHVPANVRFGGLEELRQVAFENTMGYFPNDFPGTQAGNVEEERKGKERKELWEKRPKGKRTEWERVPLGGGKRGELGNGFLCDWAWLVGGRNSRPEASTTENTLNSSTGTVEAPAVPGDGTMDIDPPLPIPETSTTKSQPTPTSSTEVLSPPVWNIPSTLIHQILSFPNKPLPSTLASLPPATLSRGIFTIKLTYLQRGTPTDRARVYALPRSNLDLKTKWQALLPASKSKQEANLKREKQPQPRAGSDGYPHVPGEEDCIGFVTTGNFSLKEGLGIGVGALAFARVFGSVDVDGKVGSVVKVCIVRDVGGSLGRLARWDAV